MPKQFYEKLRKRGGVKKWRTVELGNGEYAHVAVVKKKGKRGGTTVLGEVRKKMYS